MGKHFRKSQDPATGWTTQTNQQSGAGKHAKGPDARADNDPTQGFVDMLVSSEESDRAQSFVDQLVPSDQPDSIPQRSGLRSRKRTGNDAAHWATQTRTQETNKDPHGALEQRLRSAEQRNERLLDDLASLRSENARLQEQMVTLVQENRDLGEKLRSTQRVQKALESDNASFRDENVRLSERIKALEETLARYKEAIFNQGVVPLQTKEQLARLLHGHFERAATTLFGSVKSPKTSTLSCERAEALKELRFDDNSHPNCYESEDVNAFYCVRYEMGYAFEYYFAYSHLLADLTDRFGNPTDDHPLDIVSVGSGQDLDLWGLMYAQASLQQEKARNMRVRWTGVDLETWPNRIFDPQGLILGAHHVKADICDYLGSLNYQMPAVLVFPKSISELPPDTIDAICDWIAKTRLTHPVHCIAIVHTDISNMEIAGSTYDNRSKDAVKAARIIDAFSAACNKNALRFFGDSGGHNDGHVASEGTCYQVTKTERGRSRSVSYEYNHFSNLTGWFGDYYQNDPAFSPFSKRTRGQYVTVFDAAKRLFECCHIWQAERIGSPSGRFGSCNSTSCWNKQFCPLQRYPRVKLSTMAYQIVYGASDDAATSASANPDEFIPF